MRPTIILALAWASGILSIQQATVAQDANADAGVLEESFVLTDEASKHAQFETAHAALRAKLSRRIKIDFDKTPLVDAVASIAKRIDAPIVIDQEAFDDAGISTETARTSEKLGSVKAMSGLDRILREHESSWLIRHEVIVVTTHARVWEHDEDHVYPVAEILKWMRQQGEAASEDTLKPWPRKAPQFAMVYPESPIRIPQNPVERRLIQIIKTATRDHWDEDDGAGGTIAIAGGRLVVWAPHFVHEKISDFLIRLRSLIRCCSTKSAVFCSTRGLGDPTNRKVLEKLRRHGSVQFDQTSIKNALDQISKSSGVFIHVDWHALAEAGITPAEPVTLKRRNISHKAILETLLDPLQLSAIPRDGNLSVTSKDLANEYLVPAIYDVRDLTRYTAPAKLATILRNRTVYTSWYGPIETIGGLLLVVKPYSEHEELLKIVSRMRGAKVTCQ